MNAAFYGTTQIIIKLYYNRLFYINKLVNKRLAGQKKFHDFLQND